MLTTIGAALRPGGVGEGAFTAVNLLLGNLFTALQDVVLIEINSQTKPERQFTRSALRVSGLQDGLIELRLATTEVGPNTPAS